VPDDTVLVFKCCLVKVELERSDSFNGPGINSGRPLWLRRYLIAGVSTSQAGGPH
jgi:hypothetical protein